MCQYIIIVLIVLFTNIEAQSDVKINDIQKQFQFGFDQQYEIVYENSERYETIEFNLIIDMDSYVEGFKNLNFVLLATGTKLENNTLISDIIFKSNFLSSNPFQNAQLNLIKFDREGFATSQKELKIRLDQNDIFSYSQIYFYIYGPYKFGEELPLKGDQIFYGHYSLTDKQNCFNDCSKSENKGFCDKIFHQCSCSQNSIGRDCSKSSQKISLESKFVQSKQLKTNQKEYLYFEIPSQIFELDEVINVQISLSKMTILRVAYVKVDLENGIFMPDYTLWVNFNQISDNVAFIRDEGNIKIQTDSSYINSRVVLLFLSDDDTTMKIKISYSQKQSMAISDMTVLYIIIGVIGCIILIWISYYMNRKMSGAVIGDSFQNQLLYFMNIDEYYSKFNQFQNIDNMDNLIPLPQLTCKKEKKILLKISEIDQYMPSIRYQEYLKIQNSSHECAICLDLFKIKDNLRVTMCNHAFHRQCFDQWLQNQASCPICRNDLSLQNLQEFKNYPDKYNQKGMKIIKIQIQNQNVDNEQIQVNSLQIQPNNLQMQGNNEQIQLNNEQFDENGEQIQVHNEQIKENNYQIEQNNDQQVIQIQQINQ